MFIVSFKNNKKRSKAIKSFHKNNSIFQDKVTGKSSAIDLIFEDLFGVWLNKIS